MVEEPLIDPYDFGFDDVGYGPDQGIAGKRVDTSGANRASLRPSGTYPRPSSKSSSKSIGSAGRADSVSTLAQRLGLGAVDPLLLRLGAIVMIGVLLVPLAMSFRPDSNKGSVRTEVVSGPSVELPRRASRRSTGESDASDSDVAAVTATEESPAVQSSDGSPAAPTTSPPSTTARPSHPRPSPTSVTSPNPPPPAPRWRTPCPTPSQQCQSTQTMASAAGVAEAEQPADAAPPVCQLPYTVGAGDYWIRIADAARVTLGKLLRANMATIATPIYPGDDICLPVGATLPTPPTVITAAPPTLARPRRPHQPSPPRPPRPLRRQLFPFRPPPRGPRSKR